MLLSALVFLPVLGALLIALAPGRSTKIIAGAVTLLDLALVVPLWLGFDASSTAVQHVVRLPWVPAFNIYYYLGVDGLSLPFVFLTSLLGFLAVIVSASINHRVKLYFSMVLLLESGVLGVFTALDFALFFLFWEVELLPMYLLISIWGSPPPLGRREYSAMKFLIYTILGSAFMLLGMLALHASTGSFDLIQMTHVDLSHTVIPAHLIFGLIFVAFAVKLPIVPLHTWLPDAHTDAPTAVSVLLAGVMLKMGGYGILRICLSLFPESAKLFAPALVGLAVLGVLYGAFITLQQRDLKRLVAYSSVSHMGYVLLGFGALGQAGLTGATLQMFTHGTITGLLFAAVGLVYDKAHTRQIPELGGLAARMPFVAVSFIIAGLASLGLPTMSGFVAEFLIFVGTFPVYGIATSLAAAGIVLTAGYILWTVERAFFQALPHHLAHVGDATLLERVPLVALVITIMVVGIVPSVLTDVIKVGLAPILGRFG